MTKHRSDIIGTPQASRSYSCATVAVITRTSSTHSSNYVTWIAWQLYPFTLLTLSVKWSIPMSNNPVIIQHLEYRITLTQPPSRWSVFQQPFCSNNDVQVLFDHQPWLSATQVQNTAAQGGLDRAIPVSLIPNCIVSCAWSQAVCILRRSYGF